jgi:hypothetical protein
MRDVSHALSYSFRCYSVDGSHEVLKIPCRWKIRHFTHLRLMHRVRTHQLRVVHLGKFEDTKSYGEVHPGASCSKLPEGLVVQRWVSANPGLKFNLLF